MGSAQGSVESELEQARTAPKFGAHTPLAEKLLAVAIRAQNFTGSSGVAIALSEGKEMVCRANWGTSAPEVGAKLNTENSFTGLCVRTGEALRCDDAETDQRVDAEACRALGISAIAVAPVRRGVKVIGVIAAFSDTPHTFTEKHLLILTTLAEVIVELLDDPHPVPLPPGLDAELARVTGVSQAPVASQLDKPRTASLIREGVALPTEDTAAAAPTTPPAAEKVAEMPPPRDRTSDKGVTGRDTEVRPSPTSPGALPQPPNTAVPLSGNKIAAAADAGASRLKLVKKVATLPQPDFGPELKLSSFEADASTPRRWLLLVAILAVFAVIGLISWRLHESRRARMEKQIPAAATAAPQASQPEPVEPAKAAPVEPEPELAPAPPKAKLTPSAAKTKPASERLDEAEDVTVRHVPQPVVDDAGPVRRPDTSQKAQTPEAPQLAMAAPELPAGLTKPATTFVAGPVSRVIPAKLERRIEPPYPDAARRMEIAGRVVMKATINRTGTVSSVQWVSGNEIFRDTTIAAVKQWRYKPATLNGQPVESDLEIVLNFSKK